MQDTRTPSSTGFRRRCAAWRVTFLCVAKEKSPKERPPPLVRPPASGSLGSPVCPTARADGPSLAQRRSLGVLPRGLDKRAHLGEQQGGNPEPSAPRPVNSPRSIRGNDRAGCYLRANPSPTPWRDQIVAPMQQISPHGFIGEKNMANATAGGTHSYRETVLYRRSDSE